MAYDFTFAIHFGGDIPVLGIPPMDDVTVYVKDASWSLGMMQPYQLVADDIRATVTLNNADGRFSPENSSGPYYGDLVTGIYMCIYATPSGGGGRSRIWTGLIDKIDPVPGIYNSNETVISCIGLDKTLKQSDVKYPLMQHVTTDEVLTYILDQINRPGSAQLDWQIGVPGYSELGISTFLGGAALAVSLDSGLYTFPFVGDNWDDMTNVQRAIADAVSAERGRFFIDRSGRPVFKNRRYLQTQVTLDDTFDDSDWNIIDYSHSDDIANEVIVTIHPRAITDGEVVLWELDEPVTLRVDGEKTIRTRYSEQDSDAKVSALYSNEPRIENGTLAYAYDDGSGTMVSAEAGDVRLGMIFEPEARGAKLTLTNGHSHDIEIQVIKITGRKITTYNEVEVSVRDGLSQTLYGRQPLKIDLKLVVDEDFGRQVAQYELARRSKPRGMVRSIQLSNKPDHDDKKVEYSFGKRIRIQDAKTAHDAEYFIIGERHTYQRNGQHVVKWIVEPATSSRAWLLGVTGFSELGISTYLGF